MSVKTTRPKTRHLSTYEFFEVLQIEWIQADLRIKIYPSLKDKNYWTKVCGFKQEAIERIAERNNLPTIFTDSSMRRDFEKKVYRDESYPLFTYKDEQNKSDQEYLDLLYYYHPGTDVRCEILGETKIGSIVSYTPFDAFVTVCIEGQNEKVSITKVTRIL